MLQYFYDDESGVVDISLRCRLYRTQVKSSAEEGEASISTLIIDDPDGDLIIDPFRQIYIVETAAPSGEQVVYRGYVSDREIRRGPYRIGAGREWVVQLSDPNWLIGLRIVVGSDANRPAETDLQRVQWLLTTTEANTFNGDDTYVNTTATTFDMDAADYRGQNVSSILDDCAQASGKNWWVVYFEAIGQYGLWYDFPSSVSYVSPLTLANTLADVDNTTTFAISEENTVLERSPSRLVSGVYLPYDGGYVYVQNPVVGSNTIFRDASAPSVNVKTSTKATARANRYLADNDSETDVIRTEVLLPEAQVNDIMQGQRLLISATHLPGYETPTWMRALNRTVTETSEEFLTVGLELSPIVVPTEPFSVLYRPYSATVDGSSGEVPIYWQGSGDFIPSGGWTPNPTIGPLVVDGTNPNVTGWEITGTGTIDLSMFFRTHFVAVGNETLRYRSKLNGVTFLTSDFGTAPGGFGTYVAAWNIVALAVAPGDVLSFTFQAIEPTSMRLVGVGHAAGNPDSTITGGALTP
jgi:hypothetical protein